MYDYQRTGTDFLAARPHAILGDEMGLGKSLQAIAAADEVGGPVPPVDHAGQREASHRARMGAVVEDLAHGPGRHHDL